MYKKYRHAKLLTQLKLRRGYFPARTLQISVLILAVSLAVSCMAQPTVTETIEPTSSRACFPASVFTAEEMRARVDCHPGEYRLEISNHTVVLFAFPDPIMDWAGPIFVIHIPSVSEVVLDTDGSAIFEEYKTLEGRKAIGDVLSNQELLGRILERAREIKRKSDS